MNKLWKTIQNQQRVKVLPVHSPVNNRYFHNLSFDRGTVP